MNFIQIPESSWKDIVVNFINWRLISPILLQFNEITKARHIKNVIFTDETTNIHTPNGSNEMLVQRNQKVAGQEKIA